jgi:two-component system, OmpR family, sensor histidine kinase CssS
MKRLRLSTQFYIIFTVVILLTSLFFTLGMNYVFEDFRSEQNRNQLSTYADNVFEAYLNEGLDSPFLRSEYNGYVIYKNGIKQYDSQFQIIESVYTQQQLYLRMNVWLSNEKTETYEEDTYYFHLTRFQEDILIVTFTDNTYLENLGVSFNVILRISFISIVLLGNTTILVWSRIMLDRIRKLQGEVTKLSANNYRVPIEVVGEDEISELANRIETMRKEIESNEKTKQEMIQNISHDFKTPIAVIQSYAEAIRDGIADIEDTKIITKQADILNHKVKQLIELTKLEHAVTEQERAHIKISEVIEHIYDQQKFRRDDIQFILELDNSTYFGVYDYFLSAFSNIVDNMLRYAKNTIHITLKQNVLTFENNGEHIEDHLIQTIFKPYEKGPKGQFGLGLSIVKRTMDLFKLSIEVHNTKEGVAFKIMPLE